MLLQLLGIGAASTASALVSLPDEAGGPWSPTGTRICSQRGTGCAEWPDLAMGRAYLCCVTDDVMNTCDPFCLRLLSSRPLIPQNN